MAPKRGGGRGRGSGRARPPQSLRNAMADIGMGSLANYEKMAQDAARSNVDAARSYFPELEKDKKAKAILLHESEQGLVKLSQEIERSIRASPVCVARRQKDVVSGWDGELHALTEYFYEKKTEQSDSAPPLDSLWDFDKCWIIPELMPLELIPRKNRLAKKEKAVVKRVRVRATLKAESGFDENGEAEAEAEADGAAEEDDTEQNAAAIANDDDDDLELDADYQTGNHFDDDEGYEEQDSGAEEATF